MVVGSAEGTKQREKVGPFKSKEKARAAAPCRGGERGPVRSAYLTLTSLTSNTSAWFGPTGERGLSP